MSRRPDQPRRPKKTPGSKSGSLKAAAALRARAEELRFLISETESVIAAFTQASKRPAKRPQPKKGSAPRPKPPKPPRTVPAPAKPPGRLTSKGKKETRASLQRSKTAAAILTVYDKFKSRKSERGDIVFLDRDGKRLDPRRTKKKGIGIYISTTGKSKTLLNHTIRKINGIDTNIYNYLAYRNLFFTRWIKNKKAVAKALDRVKYTEARVTVKPPKGSSVVDYPRLLKNIATHVEQEQFFLGDSQRVSVRLRLRIRHIASGEEETIDCSEFQFSMSWKKRLDVKSISRALHDIVWSVVGHALSARSYVSAGSASNILEYNRKKFGRSLADVEDFNARSGQNWGKFLYEKVQIAWCYYEIYRLDFGNPRDKGDVAEWPKNGEEFRGKA